MNDTVKHLVLLVNNKPAEQREITAHAAKAGWQVIYADDSESAITALGTQRGMRLDAIIVDQHVVGDTVCELIAQLKSRRTALPILMLAQSTSPLLAVEAMRAGATDYIIKPVAPDRLITALDATVTRADTVDELQPLTEKIAAPLEFDAIIGSSPPFRAALAIAAKSARSQVPILIEGESGTGKEMIARAVHAASPRAKTPLRIVNCTGYMDIQLASQIFGHEQAAFAGAFEQHTGLIQRADGGTLLIDEIDQMSLETQARLIEFIRTKEIQPLGAKHGFQADIRILASSNRPLPMLVESGEFREDLFFALSVVHLEIPALHARQGDIPALVRHFLARIAEQPGMRSLGITDDAIQLLCAYDWPGNVRQLQNTLFRAAIFCDGDALTIQEFPQLSNMLGEVDANRNVSQEGIGVALYSEDGNLRPLEEIEADVIRLAIGHYSGRMTEVARRLGIGRSTLYRKLSDLGIDNAA
ncbi:sigma-54 dependent transcriptional regulator [Sphingorhabdus sp. Alg239-R122]|uniref:sigma-54-dependent transcriptional regulator n=1 Tax=Sphingorhabdus sp. Alg239-R122 TaxID=2305989 RepID=UPI0013DC7714|nr:sigma-54 dependent transcriptional regulator [Sphingorhabdus sp. Alg239-R122]